MNNKIVVTRHKGLVEFLEHNNAIPKGSEVISHATPEQVTGKDVIGVLPLSLAVLANSVTEVPLRIPEEMRGKELTMEQVTEYAQESVTYKVTKVIWE